MHSTVIHDEQQGGSSIVCLADRNDLQASSTNRLDHCRRWRAEIKRQAAAAAAQAGHLLPQLKQCP